MDHLNRNLKVAAIPYSSCTMRVTGQAKGSRFFKTVMVKSVDGKKQKAISVLR